MVWCLDPAFGAGNDINDCRRREEGNGPGNCRDDNTSFREEYSRSICHVSECNALVLLRWLDWSIAYCSILVFATVCLAYWSCDTSKDLLFDEAMLGSRFWILDSGKICTELTWSCEFRVFCPVYAFCGHCFTFVVSSCERTLKKSCYGVSRSTTTPLKKTSTTTKQNTFILLYR